MTVSHDERTALADLLLSLGPDAPTLCEGWDTGDLAVHLVVREHRPDAAAGMFVKPLNRHLADVTDEYRKKPFAELVESYRQGPPVWNPMRLGDGFINLAENFVHHEDARRGGGETSPRDLPQSTRDALWSAASRSARGLVSSSGAGVRLVRTDSADAGRPEVTVGGSPEVTVTGEAGEILLWLFGRDKACTLTIDGPVDKVVRRSI
jgi:uncharacterized protein (TIGR03085 family)